MEFYTFRSHNLVIERYTTAKSSEPVMLGGLEYTSTAINRSSYKVDTVKAKNNISITFPGDHLFARTYLLPNTGDLFVDIASHLGVVFFKGELIESRWKQNKIILVFAPLLRIRKTLGERRIYQRNCPYELYGSNCRATINPVPVDVVSATRSRSLEVAYNTGNLANDRKANPFAIIPTLTGGFANLGQLAGGTIQVTNSDRQWWIVNATPTAAQLQYVNFTIETFRPHDIVAGLDTVTVTLGCRRDIDDCVQVFGNLINFGGFGAMSRVSPFASGNEDR